MVFSRIRVKFEYDGASPSTLRWTQMREMIEAIVEAVHNTAPDVDADAIIPLEVRPGSVAFAMKAPENINDALTRLAARPIDRDAPKLLAVAKKYKAQISVASHRGRWRPLQIAPSPTEHTTITSTSSYIVFVENLGGAEPRVRLRLPNDEMWSATATEELVLALGPHIYREVRASLRSKFDAATLEPRSRELIAFEPYRPAACLRHRMTV